MLNFRKLANDTYGVEVDEQRAFDFETVPGQSYNELLNSVHSHCIARIKLQDENLVYERTLKLIFSEFNNISGCVLESPN